jgi:hypothetical protein
MKKKISLPKQLAPRAHETKIPSIFSAPETRQNLLYIHREISHISRKYEDALSRAVAYWTERGIRFEEITDAQAYGGRGHILWNLVTFDMQKLSSKLTLNYRPETRTITCALQVDTRFQAITSENRAFFDVEMDAFEKYLRTGAHSEAEWREYRQTARNGLLQLLVSITLIIIATVLGRLLVMWLFR